METRLKTSQQQGSTGESFARPGILGCNPRFSRRITRELELLQKEKNIVAKLKHEDQLTSILVLISLPNDRLYAGQNHVLELQLSYYRGDKLYTYPIDPPLVVFRTNIYHPNIGEFKTGSLSTHATIPYDDMGYSAICLDILKDSTKWSQMNSLVTVVINIFALIDDPYAASPLNSHAAALWRKCERQNDFKEYSDMTHQHFLSGTDILKKYTKWFPDLSKIK